MWQRNSHSSHQTRQRTMCVERMMGGWCCLGSQLTRTWTFICWRPKAGIRLWLRFGNILLPGSLSCIHMETLLILAKCMTSSLSSELIWGSISWGIYIYILSSCFVSFILGLVIALMPFPPLAFASFMGISGSVFGCSEMGFHFLRCFLLFCCVFLFWWLIQYPFSDS